MRELALFVGFCVGVVIILVVDYLYERNLVRKGWKKYDSPFPPIK